MRKIRLGMFETNSSSCHTVVIQEGSKVDDCDMYVPEDGIIHISDGEYGWGVETLRYPEEKASYIFTDNKGNAPVLNMLKEVILEATGAKDVIFEDGGGYVDHQSAGESGRALGSKETLKRFLFSYDNFVVIDNDNH